MKSKISISVLATCALALSGCATSAKKIQPTFVSQARYEHMQCDQLRYLFAELSSKKAAIADRIDKRRTSDKIMVGVGTFVAWPALFFIKGNGDVKQEYADVSGEHDAVRAAMDVRGCA